MISFQRNIASYLKCICITATLYTISHKQNVSAFIPTSSTATTHSFTATAGRGSIGTRILPQHRPSLIASSTPSDDDNTNENNNNNEEEEEDEASRYQTRAETLRDEIRQLEATLGDRRSVNNNEQYLPPTKEVVFDEPVLAPGEKTLRGKRVMVVGANGRLGSMVCRHLLRNHPEVEEVVATVHFVGEFSTRGYGRLSYEVGAEDGVGWIGSAWGEEEQRNARFEYDDRMKDYNLDKLRVVEVELLDPTQCNTITEGVDSIIYCATDFNGSTPRSVSSLDIGLFARAILSPTKGRVEIEGLTNILGALKQTKMQQKRLDRVIGEDDGGGGLDGEHDPTSVVLVSSAPDVLGDFETPFGEFNALKRQGENVVREGFPSLSHRILQMGKYEDLFVEEALDITMEEGNFKGSRSKEEMVSREEMSRRKINRRDAAQAAVEALLDSDVGKTVQVWTSTRG